ncbi:MAG: hypothetical protein WB816_07435 [Methylocystis sp.]
MRRDRAFSRQNVDIRFHAAYHEDLEQSLKLYFSAGASSFNPRFAGYEPAQLDEELAARLAELEFASVFTVLSAVEAAFRIDYLVRCDLKKKDPISMMFRTIYREKRERARLDNDILGVWKAHTESSAKLIGDLRGALKFRNWLAHGRYLARDGQQYDYATVYALADSALNSFPLFGP